MLGRKWYRERGESKTPRGNTTVYINQKTTQLQIQRLDTAGHPPAQKGNPRLAPPRLLETNSEHAPIAASRSKKQRAGRVDWLHEFNDASGSSNALNQRLLSRLGLLGLLGKAGEDVVACGQVVARIILFG